MKKIVLLLLAAALLFGCASQPVHEGMDGGRAYRGAANPSVTIVEYSDFECPYCGKAQPTLEQLMGDYQNARLVFRHFPLPTHPRAYASAIASACAEKEGKFWQMHDLLYANQKALEEADLEKYAQQIGLDMDAYRSCVKSGEADAVVRQDMAAGIAAGVEATPTFVIGGGRVNGALPYGSFKQVIDAELARGG
jgi:protein-disulfide isomerase